MKKKLEELYFKITVFLFLNVAVLIVLGVWLWAMDSIS